MIAEQAEMLADWVKRTDATLQGKAQEAIRQIESQTGDITELRQMLSARHRRDLRMREYTRQITGIVLNAVLITLVFFVGLLAIIEKLVRK